MTATVLDAHPAFESWVSGDDPYADFRLVDGDLWQRVAEGKRRD